MCTFVFLPLVPDFADRLPVHLFELASEECAAVSSAVVEVEQIVVAVFLGQVIHETCTVEVCIGTHLKVHRRAFSLQTNH